MPNTTNYFMVSPSPSQGLVLQGQLFQHANTPAVVRKDSQRKDYTQEIQRVELESIVLTCPEISDANNLFLGGNVQRRVQPKRRRPFNTAAAGAETLRPDEYFTVCGKCRAPSENHVSCQSCGHPLLMATPAGLAHSHCPKEPRRLTLARPPIHLPALEPSSPRFFHTCYNPPPHTRVPQVDATTTQPVRLTRGCLPSSSPALGAMVGFRALKDKASRGGKQPEPIDPIVLSSDDEAVEEGVRGASRMDSLSPCPADSAHSSPAPSVGRVEAAMKDSSGSEAVDSEYFADARMRIALPRKQRMRGPSGNLVSSDCSTKRPKVMLVRPVHTCVLKPVKQDSIVLDCRSVRLGTLRRMVLKPVTFSTRNIKIETEAPHVDVLEKVELRASELTSCEWCCVRKLPTLFFQTTPAECLRLRTQLNMSRDKGRTWYDCKSADPDEKHIVLIFEKGLTIQEEMLLEEILKEIGKTNRLQGFPVRLPFQEANARLVRYNNKPREECCLDDQDEDTAELPSTFTGTVEKIVVYPPPPAIGGISVTNEDLHCLNTGEFLNDVIIDFYLKYLVLEKLKKEDSHRIHVFSSFFYKRLNQRERKTGSDTSSIPMQKKKHNRVKTWTRHVDLFQKDFIFVPINESAHWFLAVICFPGLEGPRFESNPLYVPGTVPIHCCPEEQHLPPGWAEKVGYSEQPYPCTPTPHLNLTGGSHRVRTCQSRAESVYQFLEDQHSSEDEGSEDGSLDMDDLVDARSTEWALQPTICKQPCILIMDSLRGPGRHTVVKTLQEYLEVEWEVRKGTPRSFGKEVMRGSSPLVPQQDNFSDCGVYVLQYVESFFQNTIPSFHLPMNLIEWFPQQRMKSKREEMKELILQIQSRQRTELQGLGPPHAPEH